ncbi:MAG: pilus assembly protein TadG-related protein [Bacillota bacterium]|nr:pilus assembly protein TadG-related protein [Bacillota bacterium]
MGSARRRRDGGQVAVMAAIVMGALAALIVGAIGVVWAYRSRSGLQSAADAATLAAAKQAQAAVRLSVRAHDATFHYVPEHDETTCWPNPNGGPPVCTTTHVPERSWWTDASGPYFIEVEGLFANLIPGGGWRDAAGCFSGQPQDGVTYRLCDGWTVDDAWWTYPPGSDPWGAAMASLRQNLGAWASDIQVLDWQVNPDGRSGEIRLTARGPLEGNPLGAVTKRPPAVTVLAWARPKAETVRDLIGKSGT